MKNMTKKNGILFCLFLLLATYHTTGRESDSAANVRVKATVTDEHTIRLRWAPTNVKAWMEGKKYGYTVERHTLIVDGKWLETQDRPVSIRQIFPAPLTEWERAINTSDYAAVIAQAFYGEKFELNAQPGDMGGIINQANELEQRFATSIFMAEYDYEAAGLAGWAWTDSLAGKNEKYLYRVFSNRPGEPDANDTAAVFISYDDKRPLPSPIGLNVLFGDKSALLSWNYALQANTYHSYYVERMSPGENRFRRLTALPVTVLNVDMREIFYTDSLPENETEYAYRVIGVTSFGEEGAVSDTVRGEGRKAVSCVPHIYSGDFMSADKAHIYWEFNCEETDAVDRFQIRRSDSPEGDYLLITDHIPVTQRELSFDLPGDMNYLKIYAVNKDSTCRESFPFLMRQVDSIPPAVPSGLKVVIDTLCVAYLSWDANSESDFRGYRILRSFTKEEEKSSITSDFITQNEYTDTLSLSLLNSNVYYSITALDIRYNESQPCEDAVAVKPNNATPDEPVLTAYEISGNKVTLSWITDETHPDIQYALIRRGADDPENGVCVFSGNYMVNTYTDELKESGAYRYHVTATGTDGKRSVSPQMPEFTITVEEVLNVVSGFNSYVDRDKNYIELFWRKHDKAQSYRIYKQEGEKPASLWKETEALQNRVVDEWVSPDTQYKYTIVYISKEGRTSQSKTIVINY
jgi:fibronectin type 3 domain-containing protein